MLVTCDQTPTSCMKNQSKQGQIRKMTNNGIEPSACKRHTPSRERQDHKQRNCYKTHHSKIPSWTHSTEFAVTAFSFNIPVVSCTDKHQTIQK